MTSQYDSSPSKSRTSSSTVASTSVRPRNKRLISGLEEFAETTNVTTNLPKPLGSPTASYLDSPFHSRPASPIPSKHPSRSSSVRPPASRSVLTGNSSALGAGSDLTSSITDLWGKSWTSLQTIASNVLGNDPTDPIKDNPSGPRRPRASVSTRWNLPASKWGPSAITQPGAGSREERNAMVRAKQRQDLLMQIGHGDSYFTNPALQYKRRNSDDYESSSAPPSHLDNREALVYVHQVAPHDTLPGISIKFNCPMAAIKRSNGMWANDDIQARKTLIIPVDACNVKGKRLVGQDKTTQDLLIGSTSRDNEATPTQQSVDWANDIRRGAASNIKPPTWTVNSGTEEAKPPDDSVWTHESWILIDGHPHAIQIARLPRRHLGFFPRARRKSNAMSDVDPSPVSPEQPRSSLAISDSSSAGKQTLHKSRRSSSSQDFGKHMMGPGGVGQLKGKGPSAPGPAEDKLNKVFSKHLPNVAPPPRPYVDDGSPALDQYSQGVNLDNVGTVIQGWVNRLATGASKVMEIPPPNYARPLRNGRPQRAGEGVQPTSSGDLIELADAFEIGEDDDEANHTDFVDRGRDRTPTDGQRASVTGGSSAASSSKRRDYG